MHMAVASKRRSECAYQCLLCGCVLSLCVVQQDTSRVGLNRILTPISGLAGWIIVVAGALSSALVCAP